MAACLSKRALSKAPLMFLAFSDVLPANAVIAHIGLSEVGIEMLTCLPMRYPIGNAKLVQLRLETLRPSRP